MGRIFSQWLLPFFNSCVSVPPCSLVEFLCFCALVFWLISFSFIIIILYELGQGQLGQVFSKCDGLDISFLILSHLLVNTFNVANIFNVNGCYSFVNLFTYHCSFALFSDGHIEHLQHHSCGQNITQFMEIFLKNIELIPHPWRVVACQRMNAWYIYF